MSHQQTYGSVVILIVVIFTTGVAAQDAALVRNPALPIISAGKAPPMVESWAAVFVTSALSEAS